MGEASATDELNKRLKYLQESGVNIKDVKVSLSAEGATEHRTYLVTYEAEKPVDLGKMYKAIESR